MWAPGCDSVEAGGVSAECRLAICLCSSSLTSFNPECSWAQADPDHSCRLAYPEDQYKSPWSLLQGAITVLVCISSSHTLKHITETLWPLWWLSCLSCLLDTSLCPPVRSGLFFYIPSMLLGRAAKGSDQPLLRPMGAWWFLTISSLRQLQMFI